VRLRFRRVVANGFADLGAFLAASARSRQESFEKRGLAAALRSGERYAARTSALRVSFFAHINLP
jgi:hypothetical protein